MYIYNVSTYYVIFIIKLTHTIEKASCKLINYLMYSRKQIRSSPKQLCVILLLPLLWTIEASLTNLLYGLFFRNNVVRSF